VASQRGRVDYIRWRWNATGELEPLAARGGSALGSTVLADGFLCVPEERDSLEAGEAVRGWLYDLERATPPPEVA
jgi:molybdopterin biosynthesis enzyme